MPCYDPQAHGIPTHAHVLTLLTSRGMQALIVVYSVKLYLTAFLMSGSIDFPLFDISLYINMGLIRASGQIEFICDVRSVMLLPCVCVFLLHFI